MDEIFRLRVSIRAVCSRHRLNLDIPKVNQVSFGYKSIIYLNQQFEILSRLP